MSSDARQAPVPPRPTTPPARNHGTGPSAPAPGTPWPEPRPESDTPARTGADTSPDTHPRFPRPFRFQQSPAPAPPPSPSARFPDSPPTVGHEPPPRPAPEAAAPPPRQEPAGPSRAAQAAGPKPADGTGQPFRLPAPPAPGRPDRTAVTLPRQGSGTAPTTGAEDAKDAASRTAAGRPFPPPAAAPQPPAPAPPPRAAPGPPPAPPVSPVSPDPAHSWSASRQAAFHGEPERHEEPPPTRPPAGRPRARTAAAAACAVLGLGLISGAVTGSWLTGGSGDTRSADGFTLAAGLWHTMPVDRLFPPTVRGTGAGPGGADRTWTRIAVAPDSGCAGAFDPLLRKVLAPVGCARLLRATYTDATQSHVTTVGLLFTKADSAAMTSLATRFGKERLDRRTDLMPRPYAAKNTAAAGFGVRQRASWTISVLTDAPVVAYAVSGWADGRTVDVPQPAADVTRSDATSATAQAGLGQEAQGLADRIQRSLRKTVRSATETPS